MANNKDKGFVDRLWDFLASIKLAIIIFALIGLTSIVGTVIEQRASYARNIEVIGKIFGEELAPSVYKFFYTLGFMDMFHSWWFVGLLIAFSVNLLICSIDRFPKIWKLVRTPLRPLSKDAFKAFPIKKEFTIKGDPEKVAGDVRVRLRKLLAPGPVGWAIFLVLLIPIFISELVSTMKMKVKENAEEGGAIQFYSERGNYTRLGVYITHFSILVIFAGAIVGLLLGFNGFVEIPEGASRPFAFARTGGNYTQSEENEINTVLNTLLNTGGSITATASALNTNPDSLKARMKYLGVQPLDFMVRCDEFEVQYYPQSFAPMEYTSHLTVIKDDKVVLQKWIEVNDPLKFEGYTFYQSSYGMVQNPLAGVFKLKVITASGKAEEENLRLGESFVIPGTDINVKVVEFSHSLWYDSNGAPYTNNQSQMMDNPATKLEITQNGQTYNKWVLQRFPQSGEIEGGHVIQMLDLWGAQQTGLQVRKDPGVWLVYLGCITMTIGLFMAFFISHRKIWVLLVPEKNTTRVLIAASAHRNRQAFERGIDAFAALFEEGGK